VALEPDGFWQAPLDPLGPLRCRLERRHRFRGLLGIPRSHGRQAALFHLAWDEPIIPTRSVVRSPCDDRKEIFSLLSSLNYHIKVLELIFGHWVSHD
jgi:hypothetical protein